MKISDIANAFLIFGLCAASACFVELLEGGYEAQRDSLPARHGDMADNTYYAGDVVARYASEKETVTAFDMASREQKIMLTDLARHMGRAP